MSLEEYVEAIKDTLKEHQGKNYCLSIFDVYGGDLFGTSVHFLEFHSKDHSATFEDCSDPNIHYDVRLDLIGTVSYQPTPTEESHRQLALPFAQSQPDKGHAPQTRQRDDFDFRDFINA